MKRFIAVISVLLCGCGTTEQPMLTSASPLPAMVNCDASAPSAKDVLFKIPFKIVDGRIYVDAKVNGKGPFVFAIDTGASGLGRSDASLTKALALPITKTGETSDGVNNATVDVTRFTTLEIGGYSRQDMEVITRDYRSRMAPEMAFSGIIGRDFFADGIVTIDYPSRTLSFSRTGALPPDGKFVLSYERPFRVPVMIGDIATEGNLDTGANVEFVMPKPLFDQLSASPLHGSKQATLTNTKLTMSTATVKGPIIIGGAVVADAEVRVSDRFPELLVGARILQNYRIIIDQRSKLVAICPSQMSVQPG